MPHLETDIGLPCPLSQMAGNGQGEGDYLECEKGSAIIVNADSTAHRAPGDDIDMWLATLMAD